MQTGDFKQAEKAFRQCLNIRPGDAKTLDNLGLSLEAQSRNEEALEVYKQAVARPEQEGSSKELPSLDYGTLLDNESRAAEGLPYLKHAVTLAPKNPRCHDELSRAQAAIGDIPGAIRSLEEAEALEPANPRFHFKLSQLYRRLGQTTKADAEAHESARLYGTHSVDPSH